MKTGAKTQGEKRFIFGLDREKIEKLIRGTAIAFALNHILVSVWVIVYNIGVPSARGLDKIYAGLVLAEIVLLMVYIVMNETGAKQKIYGLFKAYFTKDQLLLGLLPLIYYVCLVYYAATEGIPNPEDNFKNFMDCLINVFVIYPLGRYYFKHKIPRTLEIIIHILMIGITCYIVYVLYNVFNGVVLTTYFRGKIGMMKQDFGNGTEYHLQINSHHNTTGAFSALFTLLSVSMAVWKKGIFRILYLVIAFIHSIVLVLSNSRSTFLSGCVFLALLAGVVVYFVIKHKWIDKRVLRWIISLIVVIGFFFILVTLRNSVFWIYGKCTGTGMVEQALNVSENVGPSDTAVTTEALSRDLEVSNLMGREIIWGCAITGMVMNNRNLLIGVTPCGTGSVIYELSNGRFPVYTHNQILEIGLGLGVPAMMVFVLWLVLLANRCVMIGFADETRMGVRHKCVPLLVLFLVMFNMFEAILFFSNTFVGGVFMLTSAWCFEAARFGSVAKDGRFLGVFMQRKESN